MRQGYKHTEETKQKMSNSHKGKIFTEEHKRKISEYSKTRNNSKNPFWKGGVSKLNIPLYDTYVSQLEPIEKCKKTEEGHLQVKCTYCSKWYVPSRDEIKTRVKVINGKEVGENRLYCSKECKSNCPIYRKSKYPSVYKATTSREVQPELRQFVFERDDWTCIKCGANTNLHCHHIEGLKHNPLMSADMDLCITLCKSCHKEVHKRKDCGYKDMKCKEI